MCSNIQKKFLFCWLPCLNINSSSVLLGSNYLSWHNCVAFVHDWPHDGLRIICYVKLYPISNRRCEPCVEILFARGAGLCYTCKIPLRKNNFRIQQFESAEVERYVEIRKRIAKDYNKMRSDFETLQEYNDYLEEVETIAYNLTHDINVEETKRRMEKYKLENQEQIKKNRNKISPEEAELNRLIEEEELRHKTRMEQRRMAEENARIQREKKKMDLLNDFMFSDLPANKILMNHREVEEQERKQRTEEMQKIEDKVSKFSSGIYIGKQETVAAPTLSTDGSLTLEDAEYSPFCRQTEGPDDLSEEELLNLNYLSKVRPVDAKEIGCGFRAVTFCSRALSDAYNGLFISC